MTYLSWPEGVFVLIPAYKAAEDLQRFLPSLLEKVPREKICLVDDASFDQTEDICRKYAMEYHAHAANQGKGAALKTGFASLLQKGARWILTMDADGQHAVSDIPLFLDAVKAFPDAGIIIGARNFTLKTMPLGRIFSNSITSQALSRLCGGKKILDSQSGFRLYSAELIRQTPLFFNRFEMESEVLLKACAKGYAIEFVPIQTLYCGGKSHISHLKDMYRWIRAVWSIWREVKRANEGK
jgi:glycosyltransferase involved in cell wall biosynthesis